MTYDVFDKDNPIRFSSNYYAKPKITIGDIINFGYDENEKAIVTSIVNKTWIFTNTEYVFCLYKFNKGYIFKFEKSINNLKYIYGDHIVQLN